jgi:prevent-host-death family protein
MSGVSIGLAEAKAQLSELAARAARGETVLITKHGKPLAQLVSAEVPRRPVPLDLLRKVTDAMPKQTQSAGKFMREQRDNERF